MSEIFEVLPRLRADLGAIAKARKNIALGYSFRGIDDVLNGLAPVLNKHGLTLTLEVRDHKVAATPHTDEKGRVRTTYHATLAMSVKLFAPDSSSVEFVSVGEGLDTSGDKATYKAMAGAYKYAILLGLTVPVEARALEDPDDAPRHEAATSTATNGAPGDEIAPYTKAITAIANAASIGQLSRYLEAISTRTAAGEFTADDFRKLVQTIEVRKAQLTPIPNGGTDTDLIDLLKVKLSNAHTEADTASARKWIVLKQPNAATLAEADVLCQAVLDELAEKAAS